MRPRTKKEQREQTRALIIKEAIHLFARQGFAPTGIQDLAKAIGMTSGTLYWHFEDKEALLIAVIEELERRLAVDLTRGAETLGEAGPVQTMEALIARVAQQVEQHLENLLLIGVVGAEAIDTNPRVEKALRKAYDGFAAVAEGLLEQAKKEGLVERSLDAACTAQMFIGMYMGGILHQRLYRKEFPLNRSLPVLQEMLLRSVVGALPARHLRKSPPTPKPR